METNVPQNTGSCEGCRYAQPVVTRRESVIMECFRYPATVIAIDNEVYQVRPDADYRCGEYKKPRDEEIADLKQTLQTLKDDLGTKK